VKTVIFFLSVLIVTSAFAGTKQNEKVKKAIQNSIELLEKDNIQLFLDSFIHPLEATEKKIIVDREFVLKFKKEKKDQLLSLFKSLENSTPLFSSETTVSYLFKKENKDKFLTFKLYKNQWYLSNDMK